MNNKAKINAAKYAVYVVVMILFYVLQTTPDLFSIFGVKPNIVIPAAVCIAILEGEFVGGIYGAVAGVLCDLGQLSLFGFNSLILLVACVLIGLAFIYMLRATAINFSLILLLVLLIRGMLDFLFHYAIWGYANVSILLVSRILPSVVYSVAVGPLVYYLYGWIYRKFDTLIQG